MYTDYPYGEFTNWRSFLMDGNRFLWERPCFAPAYARSMGQVVDLDAFLEAVFSGRKRSGSRVKIRGAPTHQDDRIFE